MNRGYIKLWRKSIEGGWLQDPELWTFWCWCLLKATHKPIKIVVGLQEVDLQPGQFVFGLKSASKELKMSIRKIRTRLNFLQTSSNLTHKTTNKFSIISVVNWQIYQTEENANDTLNDKPLTSKRQASDNKQEHKNKRTIRIKDYSSDFLRFYEEYPKHQGKDPAWQAWNKQNGNRPDIDTLINIIIKNKTSVQWTKDNGQFIPLPSTWINQCRWDDVLDFEQHGGIDEWVRSRTLPTS